MRKCDYHPTLRYPLNKYNYEFFTKDITIIIREYGYSDNILWLGIGTFYIYIYPHRQYVRFIRDNITKNVLYPY